MHGMLCMDGMIYMRFLDLVLSIDSHFKTEAHILVHVCLYVCMYVCKERKGNSGIFVQG